MPQSQQNLWIPIVRREADDQGSHATISDRVSGVKAGREWIDLVDRISGHCRFAVELNDFQFSLVVAVTPIARNARGRNLDPNANIGRVSVNSKSISLRTLFQPRVRCHAGHANIYPEEHTGILVGMMAVGGALRGT